MHIATLLWIGIAFLSQIIILGIGIRYFRYFDSFFFHWQKFIQHTSVDTATLLTLPDIPNIKIQITTRGSQGSLEVIRRSIAQVQQLSLEAPLFYTHIFTIEVITEDPQQQSVLESEYAQSYIPVSVLVLPLDYQTTHTTGMKARALQYVVEQRRAGWHRKQGKTFILHFDEESLIRVADMRDLLAMLSKTEKRLLEGPIFYPLEYMDAHPLCRAMEATRPMGCFECRHVMEHGIPLHLHGSNLVVEESLELELGWDFGRLDGQPYIAEDYVFGVLAYLKYGSEIFGWHGCVMLEQPPFSLKSAFRQRYRWVIGVFQGLSLLRKSGYKQETGYWIRWRLFAGSLYRILSFALGLPAGLCSFSSILLEDILLLTGHRVVLLPWYLSFFFLLLGFFWLNTVIIGSWYNLSNATQLTIYQKVQECALAIALSPVAGFIESSAACWALIRWIQGKRNVEWIPTPKTIFADKLLA